jgi:hypothetical protein
MLVHVCDPESPFPKHHQCDGNPITINSKVYAAMLACLTNIWKQREELFQTDDLDIEEEMRDVLYSAGVEVCIAEDIGRDECRCEECMDAFAAEADHLRDLAKETS